MKKFIFAIVLFSACSQPNDDIRNKSKQEIANADKSMSTMAEKEGFLTALLQYADDDLVKLNEGQFPIIGKLAFKEKCGDKKGATTLTWEPIKTDAAKSGDLGYSFGNWKYVTPDSTYFGNYFTVWVKQVDGSWKWALDGGNNTPAIKKN